MEATYMRKRLFATIELAQGQDRLSACYDYTMMLVILASLVPLAFKSTNTFFQWIDHVTAAVFILDYALRLMTADLKLKKGAVSFLLYPFTPMALIDLLAILPTFTVLLPGLRLVKLFRLFRTFRVFRSLKMFRYAKSVPRCWRCVGCPSATSSFPR